MPLAITSLLPPVTDLAKTFIARVLREGGVAVDATVGNGHDTLFLAQRVGPSGRVFGFDVQAHALDAARERLRAEGVLDRVELVAAGHEHLRRSVPRERHGRVQAVMFNLGYLPNGPDKNVTTAPETTLEALRTAVDLLAPGGVLTVVTYRAHPGGREEARRVEQWAAQLSRPLFEVYVYRPLNTSADAPRLVAVAKRDRTPSVTTHEPPRLA